MLVDCIWNCMGRYVDYLNCQSKGKRCYLRFHMLPQFDHLIDARWKYWDHYIIVSGINLEWIVAEASNNKDWYFQLKDQYFGSTAKSRHGHPSRWVEHFYIVTMDTVFETWLQFSLLNPLHWRRHVANLKCEGFPTQVALCYVKSWLQICLAPLLIVFISWLHKLSTCGFLHRWKLCYTAHLEILISNLGTHSIVDAMCLVIFLLVSFHFEW